MSASAAGPTLNIRPGDPLPTGFSWEGDQIVGPGRQVQIGDPYSWTMYDGDGNRTVGYQSWNRIPGPLDTNEIGSIGGLLGPMTGGASVLAVPFVQRLMGGADPGASGTSGPGGSSGRGGLGGLENLLPLLLAGGLLGNQQPQRPAQTSAPPMSDPFAGQNQFAQNPFSSESSFGGISPIGPLMQTSLQRIRYA